jgi:ribonuclease HI
MLAVSEPGTQPRQDSAPERGFYVLKTDGGISREPGRASGQGAIGAVLKDESDREVDTLSKLIGWVRNHNVAEYRALIAGLELARRHGIDRIRVFADSALVVKTVNGTSNLWAEHLQGLRARAVALVDEFADIELSRVPREMNVEADALASRALGRGRCGPARVARMTRRKAAWRDLPPADLAAHLLAVPQICDRTWTSERRLPRETRQAFIARLLLGGGAIQ